MKFSLTAFLILFLAACGFTPMYGSSGTSAVAGLDKVDIALIPNESGVYLRNVLIDHFYQDGYPSSPDYTLDVAEVKQNLNDLDITEDSEATRKQIRLRTSLKLVRKSDGVEVLSRDLSSVTSYNVLGSQFTTRVSEKDAREAGLNDLARQIESHVALYFKR